MNPAAGVERRGRPASEWHWSEDAVPAVNLCVLALTRDGLRVPPFDQHPDGDRALRKLGLDADGWLGWVAAVATAHAELRASWTGSGGTGPAEGSSVLGSPGELYPGSRRLCDALGAMWADHRADLAAWKRSVAGGRVAGLRRGHGREEPQRWETLSHFREQLSTLAVLLVDYPVPAVLPVPPISLLVAPAADAASYTNQLVSGATALAADPRRLAR